jgi:hypothetical protein
MEGKRWIGFYLIGLGAMFSVVMIFIAHESLTPRIVENRLLLAALSAMVLLSPSLILESASLFVINLLMGIHVVTMTILPGTVVWLSLYLLDIAIGLCLLAVFRLPYGLAILPFVFPGLSVLYFLVIGQIRSKSESIRWRRPFHRRM